MKRTRSVGAFLMVMAALVVIGGCAGSHPGRKVDIGGATLVNPDLLQEGTGDQALYRYVKPGTDIRRYTKVLVDPVLIRKDGELDKDELENYQKLANNAHVYLVRELEKDYTIVQTPEPGTLRVQAAIVDADSSKPVRNTFSTVMPIGMVVSLAKYGATGKQSGVGEITMEMKITDASTGNLLGAALDRRVGGKEINKLWSAWHNADAGLQYWAKRLSYALCDIRGGTNCVKP